MSAVTAPVATSKLWYLKRIPLFSGFSDDELHDVERLTRMRRCAKGEVLYLPGQRGEFLYMLKAGVVKISRLLPDGRELTLALLKPGDVFGEVEVIGDTPAGDQAMAYHDVLLCVIHRADFLRWMSRKPDLALRVTKLIGLRRHVIEHRIERLLFRSAPAKVAALLLDLAEQFGRRGPEGVALELPLTHQEIANLTGSVRETVSDVLGTFRVRGWVRAEGRRLCLTDTEALRRAAAG
jgi:CRP-like cAMP-binding protein